MSAGDWKDMYGAAVRGDLELVQYHIKRGVNPNYQHPEILSTPLVASIIGGHHAIAEFLLNHGADPALVSVFDNMTPLQAAKTYQRADILEILKARLPEPPQSWWSALLAKIKSR